MHRYTRQVHGTTVLGVARALGTGAAVATLLALGCAGDPGPELAELPAEKTAADFPGLSYPTHEGEIPRPGKRGGPLWLVGIDGATWELMRPLMADGELPNLERLVDGGAHGVLASEEPMISPALWTTIATGVPRFAHGIGDFTVKLPASYEVAGSGPPDRRWPALWELVGAAGGTSAVISWCSSYPAEEIPGVYLSEALDPARPKPLQVHPPSLLETVRERTKVVIPAVDEERIAHTTYLRNTLLRDLRTMALMRLLVRDAAVDLVAVYLSGVDVVQHITWRHMDPASQQFPQDGAPEPALSEVIPDYYRMVDRLVGEMVEMAPADATLVVLSDHGGGPVQPAEAYHFQLDVLLETLGLMQGTQGPLFTIGQIYRHDKLAWLNLEGVEPAGVVPLEQADEVAAEVAARLRRLETDDGRPLLAAVVNHVEEPDWQPGDPGLTVRFSTHSLLTSQVHDGAASHDFAPVRLRHNDISGVHRRDGIVILHGPAIRPGPLKREANQYQVAPTVLYLLGLPQDARMLRLAPADGGVLTEAIDPEVLEERPIRMVGEYPGTDRQAVRREAAGDRAPIDDDELERLRRLGYVR
jgi:predicted AlkP superfamily phosphohydrolase/phosphomutase